jgi:antitoxin (DNA-binding transcriptional repressor) of toxin-antitoxin stability system
MHEAKTRLTELVAAVENGERVVITRHGKPAAELVQPRRRAGGLDLAAIEAFRASASSGLALDLAEIDKAMQPMGAEELFGPEWAEGPVLPDHKPA